MQMGGEFLLDTNIVIALLAEDKSVTHQLSQADAALLPSPVVGELYFGARHSSRIKENLEKVSELTTAFSVVECGIQTAWHYGQIKQQLRSKGTPIPENDIWIAALAVEYGLILVSRDQHFSYIEGLSWNRW